MTDTAPPFDDLKRGHVVLAPDPFKPDDDTTRPWVVVNNESHPFDKQQYVAMGLTHSERKPTRLRVGASDSRLQYSTGGRSPAIPTL